MSKVNVALMVNVYIRKLNGILFTRLMQCVLNSMVFDFCRNTMFDSKVIDATPDGSVVCFCSA